MRIKRQIPGVNSSSSADIAFLLLIFFLLTSSIEKDQSLSQLLPEKKEQQEDPQEIKKRDIFELRLDTGNAIMYKDETISIKELKSRAKEFILNEEDNPDLPLRMYKEITLFGEKLITPDHLFLIRIDRLSSYQTYIHVQNTIISAYNELRNEAALKKWGKKYTALTPEQKNALQQLYPYRIAESETEE